MSNMFNQSNAFSTLHKRYCPIFLAALAPLVSSCVAQTDPAVSATTMESLEDGVGGIKAIAQPGDFVLDNNYARIAILSNRASLGPGLSGGTLVDADIIRRDLGARRGEGQDQFAELFPTGNMNITETLDQENGVRILKDGSDGEAIVRVQGESFPFLSLLDALWLLVRAPDFWLYTDYIARQDESWFTIRTTAHFSSTALAGDELPETDLMLGTTETFDLIGIAIETGMVQGDFYLQGGSVNVFSPGVGFDEDGAVFEATEAGLNTFSEPFQFPFIAGVADGVSYGLASSDGDLWVPLFTSSQTIAIGAVQEGDGSQQRFPLNSALTYERYFFVGHGDVASIVDQWVEALKIPYGEVSGFAVEAGTGAPLVDAEVFLYKPGEEGPYSHFKVDIHPDDTVADASFAGRVPVGDWELEVHERGRPTSKRVKIKVKKGESLDVVLEGGRAGALTVDVIDEMGRNVPAKITIYRQGKAPTRRPMLGDGFIGGHPETVLFSMYGRAETILAPGKYRAVASRGIEYELAESDVFEVLPGGRVPLELMVVHSVDTEGWVSADLHVHAQKSHDSGVSLAGRVQTMVCEGIEFFSSTDHDYLVDYAPTVEELGMGQWVQTAIGNETTTVEVGHFLGFPLDSNFLGESGYNREEVDWTGKTPDEIIGSLRTMGESAGLDPVVFVGHPRDGILGYFDQFGFDPYGGTPSPVPGEVGNPNIATPLLSLYNDLLVSSNVSWEFDAIELLNGKRFDYLRTPTMVEQDGFQAGTHDIYDYMTRTLDEQKDLEEGVYKLGDGNHGQIDDWFTLLNLGFRFTALGNSDTHGITGIESGCPRNFIMSDTDSPVFIDDQEMADAVKEHRVVASYGPFVQMWIDGSPIGSDVVAKNGTVDLEFEVQAPTWITVNRVELYQNGNLIEQWEVKNPDDVLKIAKNITLTPEKDSWYVLIASGDGDLSPVFSPVEQPHVELQKIVLGALGGIEAVGSLIGEGISIPRAYPVRPFALTNPIWVDVDGDGFVAPGIPDWMAEQ